MDISIFVAKVAAVLYISAGIGALTKSYDYSKFIKDFQRSPALTYITGFIAIVLGMLLVETHNSWSQDWRIVVTIIGWAALIKGVLFVAFPNFMLGFKSAFKNSQATGVMMVGIGCFFAYLGFLA